MAKPLLLLLRQGPAAGPIARERLDIALMGLALEQAVTVVFVDDGVYQLLPQTDDGSGHSLLKTIRSLRLYDVEAICVERESLAEHRIGQVDPIATEIDREALVEMIASHQLVL